MWVWKYGLFKNFLYSYVEVGKLLLVKCRQILSNRIKKSSLFFFGKFLCLLDLRDYFCLKRATLCLEFRIKFNWYSMRSFQKELMGFNNLWIQFIFRDFNWVPMSKIPTPTLQMESWAFHSRGSCIFCQFPFWYIFK